MLLALAAILAMLWIISFLILHVSQIVVHVLIIGAALSALVHFIRVRRVHHHPNDLKEVPR
jgi:hypothetical protein